MGDDKDLEELGELVEVLKNIKHKDCDNCPLSFSGHVLEDECDMIRYSAFDGNIFSVLSHAVCNDIIGKKVDEIITYIFERSLKDG